MNWRSQPMKRALTILAILTGAATFAHAQQPDPGAIKHPHLVVEPRALDFDGTTPGSRTFTIRNKGNAALAIQKVAPAPDAYGFIVPDPVPGTIAPGGA